MAANTKLNEQEWLYLEQTIKMLSLAIAQIETALHEGNHAAATMGDSFNDIRSLLNVVRQDSPESVDNCNTIEKLVNSTVIDMQFYDRLSQRVDHVQNGLRKLLEIMNDPEALVDPTQWKQSQDQIKASYTMEAERLMFEKIMKGEDLDEALKIYRHNFSNSVTGVEEDSGDIIELF